MLDSYELAKFFASFALVVLFLYALYYYFGNNMAKFSKQGREIVVKESRVVGKDRYILLVEVKGKTLLLASDEKGIRVLKEWKEEGESV